MQSTQPKIENFFELHFVVVLFGFTAILGKLITLSALELVFYRTLLASLGLFGLIYVLKKSVLINKKDIIKLFGIGIIVSLHWFLFFYSARVSNVSVSLVGLATSTLWIALLQPFFSKSAIRISEICLGVTMILGLYLIFNSDLNNWLGLLLSIGSGLMQAVFSLFNSKFTQKYHSFIITFYEMAGAFLTTGLFLFFSNQTSIFTGSYPNLQNLLWLLILAFLCSVYAYSAVVRLLKNISAFSVNLAINLEPVYGIILAYFIFGEAEKMTIGFYFGTFIICLAVFGYQIFGMKK
ncbi:MAG: EamA family transporter [Bacteroidota bacterium]